MLTRDHGYSRLVIAYTVTYAARSAITATAELLVNLMTEVLFQLNKMLQSNYKKIICLEYLECTVLYS